MGDYRLVTDERGANLAEWGLLVSLIAIVALVAVAAFGQELLDLLNTIVDAM